MASPKQVQDPAAAALFAIEEALNFADGVSTPSGDPQKLPLSTEFRKALKRSLAHPHESNNPGAASLLVIEEALNLVSQATPEPKPVRDDWESEPVLLSAGRRDYWARVDRVDLIMSLGAFTLSTFMLIESLAHWAFHENAGWSGGVAALALGLALTTLFRDRMIAEKL